MPVAIRLQSQPGSSQTCGGVFGARNLIRRKALPFHVWRQRDRHRRSLLAYGRASVDLGGRAFGCPIPLMSVYGTFLPNKLKATCLVMRAWTFFRDPDGAQAIAQRGRRNAPTIEA